MPVDGVGGGGVLTGVSAIAAGSHHSVALRSDGSVVAWGFGREGQLGNGGTTDQHAPVQVLGVGGSGGLTNIVAITGGSAHSLALRSNGTAVAWGRDQSGELGDSAALADAASPVLVATSGVAALALGSSAHHCLVLTR
jgi:alpha-tubulin suppressor-like RCC1 family protein